MALACSALYLAGCQYPGKSFRRQLQTSSVFIRGGALSRGRPGAAVKMCRSSAVSFFGQLMSAFEKTDGLSPMWASIKKADSNGLVAALAAKADPNERDPDGLTPLHFFARAGHYRYPPGDLPLKIVKAGADLEVKDSDGRTALDVSLLKGWQKISYLLLEHKAKTDGVAAIKGAITCPDCKRVVAEYKL